VTPAAVAVLDIYLNLANLAPDVSRETLAC
jgi:hypothetical protein